MPVKCQVLRFQKSFGNTAGLHYVKCPVNLGIAQALTEFTRPVTYLQFPPQLALPLPLLARQVSRGQVTTFQRPAQVMGSDISTQ